MRRMFWLLTPVLLLALFYGLLPRLASYSIEGWLQARGLEQVRIEFDYPHWNRLQIRRLTLSQQQDGQRIELDADSILIDFDPLDLLGRLHLNRVRIPGLRLHLQHSAKSAATAPDALDLRPLLPAAWLVLAPADALQIDELDLTYVAPDQPARRLRGPVLLQQGELTQSRLHSRLQLFEDERPQGWFDLELDQHNQFALQLLHNGASIYRAGGQLTDDGERLQIQLEQSLDLAALRRWQPRWVPEGLPLVDGRLETRGVVSLPLRLAADSSQWLQTVRLDLETQARLQIDPARPDVQQIQLPLDARLRLADGLLGVSLPAGTRALLQQLTLPGLAPVDARVTLVSPLDMDVPIAHPTVGLRLPALSLLLSSEPLQHAKGQLSFSPLSLSFSALDLAQQSARGRIQATNIRWQAPGQVLPAMALDSRFELRAGMLENRFELRIDEPALNLSGRASTRLAAQVSDIHWQAAPLALQQAETLWNRYHPPAPPELGISAGVLHHNGSAHWDGQTLALRLEQQVDQLTAHWGATTLQDARWQSTTLLRHSGRLEHQGTLQVPQLDAGFPVHNIALDYQLRQAPGQAPSLLLQGLAAELLGGSLTLNSVTINPLSPTLSADLKLQQLQLARLLELQQQPGLSGEGTLSGVLPLSYDSKGLHVRNGHIASDGPGWIRFQPGARIAALGQAHQGMAMALQALKNFQYQALSVDVQYSPDGATLMNTRLQGSNPDWHNGRPVDFSINIEQNLLTLMQTLQFTGKLTESIEKRYR
jgi:hypothetical protein